jgi:hypothetical protein
MGKLKEFIREMIEFQLKYPTSMQKGWALGKMSNAKREERRKKEIEKELKKEKISWQ